PLLEIAHDVLDHHDGVVDHEADGDGEAHQGQIVEAVAQQIHDGEGAHQGQRHRGAGDDRRPDMAEENEDHHHHHGDGDDDCQLYVVHRDPDGEGAVRYQIDLDRGRDGFLQ